MDICPHCGKSKDSLGLVGKVWSNHVRWCLFRKTPEKRCIFAEKIREKVRNKMVKRITTVEKTCGVCGNKFLIRKRIDGKNWNKKTSEYEREYCSRKCSNKIGSKFLTQEGRERLREAARKNAKFIEAQGKNWNTQAFRKFFSSKREREIVDYIKEKHPEDNWTFGRLCRVENVNLNVDLYSHKLKTIFEYDGIWHFKDIHGQLADKKMKDTLQEMWAVNNGYRLVRVDEEVNLSLEDIEKLLYQPEKVVVKVGKRY